MKVLIFSDTHFDTTFEEKRFKFLKKIIKEADKVIINGDFWEGWLVTFSEFVDSPWKQLFPLLKEKNTVYIFGNHDRQELCDKRTELFSQQQTSRYTLQIDGKEYVFEHGNNFNFSYKKLMYNRVGLFINHNQFFIRVSRLIEGLVIQYFGRKFYLSKTKKLNDEIKTEIKKKLLSNQILICGHTHAAEIDLNNKFVNTGFIRHGVGQYIIIEDGIVNVKDESY